MAVYADSIQAKVNGTAQAVPLRDSDAQEKIDSLSEEVDNLDKIILNESMTPSELTTYGFTFNTIPGHEYTIYIPKTIGYKVASLYKDADLQNKVMGLIDDTDNRNEKISKLKADRDHYHIDYQAISPNQKYAVVVMDNIGVFDYVRNNMTSMDSILGMDFSEFATKDYVDQKENYAIIDIKNAELLNEACTKVETKKMYKHFDYKLKITPNQNGYMLAKAVTKFNDKNEYSYQIGYSIGSAIQLTKDEQIEFAIPRDNYIGFAFQGNNSSCELLIEIVSENDTSENFYSENKNELINDYLSKRPFYACMGDSITSDQVTGIGTEVRKKLGFQDSGNYACGYATCSDWHQGKTNTTTVTMNIPQNTNTNDNVLSNQVRRLLQSTTPIGEKIKWVHPIDGEFSIDETVGVGIGTKEIPQIIYIAIGINDGNNKQNVFIDDSDEVMEQSYSELTRNSYASALRWAIETLQSAYHNANIFVASPLQAFSSLQWMSKESVLAKRNCTEKIAKFCGVKFIDSYYDSGFSYLIAKSDNGGVHPSEEWKHNIANFISGKIESNYCTNNRYFQN